MLVRDPKYWIEVLTKLSLVRFLEGCMLLRKGLSKPVSTITLLFSLVLLLL